MSRTQQSELFLHFNFGPDFLTETQSATQLVCPRKCTRDWGRPRQNGRVEEAQSPMVGPTALSNRPLTLANIAVSRAAAVRYKSSENCLPDYGYFLLRSFVYPFY
jgi:hypothetical protein